jgi:hypothetical protein
MVVNAEHCRLDFSLRFLKSADISNSLDTYMTEPTFRIGRKTGETISWHAPSLEGSNARCIYCGTLLRGTDPPESDKEHLIARNFVPTGTMEGQPFNFIFRACRPCNARKAFAERHVSSVTLFNSPGRLENAKVNEVAIRKGKGDFHPNKQGVLIEDAHEDTSLTTSFGPMSIKFGMVGPPQLDRNLVGEVAFSHIQGLFTLVCTEDYLDPQKLRLLPQDQFIWFGSYTHDDWGNPQVAEIANRVRNWDCLANIESAQGYFKAIMRCSDEGWFWALEWNQELRLIGGISGARMKLFEGLPSEGWSPTPQGRMRKNVPLDTKYDHLFFGVVHD